MSSDALLFSKKGDLMRALDSPLVRVRKAKGEGESELAMSRQVREKVTTQEGRRTTARDDTSEAGGNNAS